MPLVPLDLKIDDTLAKLLIVWHHRSTLCVENFPNLP